MSDFAFEALSRLRDGSNFQWYVIPLLAFVFYVYTVITSYSIHYTKLYDCSIVGESVQGYVDLVIEFQMFLQAWFPCNKFKS